MAEIKQSTARNRMFFMVSSTDHISAKTGAAPVVNLSKNAGAFGAAGGTVSEIANGWYNIALNTTDSNTLGDLAYHITGTGADDTDFCDQVVVNLSGELVAVNVTQVDGAALTAHAAGKLPADVLTWLGTAVTAATAGIPDVNVKNMNNVAATAITTVNANQGTTQPINFTGTGASALVKGDTIDIASIAITLDANNLLKVDVEDFGGVAGTFTSGRPAIQSVNNRVTANTDQWNGTGVTIGAASGFPKVDTEAWKDKLVAIALQDGIPNVCVTHWQGTSAAQAMDGGIIQSLPSVVWQTAQAGSTSSTIKLHAGANSATDNFYKGWWVYMTSGSSAGQIRAIIAYTAATRVATIDRNWFTTPGTDNFVLIPRAGVDVLFWLLTLLAANTPGIPDVNVQNWKTITVSGTDSNGNPKVDIESWRDSIPNALSAAGNIKSDIVEVNDNAVDANRLKSLMDGTVTGTVSAGATTTSIPSSGLSAVNDFYKGRLMTFTSGTLIGQQTDITAYNGGTQTFTVTALTSAPGNGDLFVIS